MHVSLRQQSGLHNRLALQKVKLDGKGQYLQHLMYKCIYKKVPQGPVCRI